MYPPCPALNRFPLSELDRLDADDRDARVVCHISGQQSGTTGPTKFVELLVTKEAVLDARWQVGIDGWFLAEPLPATFDAQLRTLCEQYNNNCYTVEVEYDWLSYPTR